VASVIVVAVTANFIPDSLNIRELKTGPNPKASFRASSKIVALYLLSVI
jgi:hypothetical protein